MARAVEVSKIPTTQYLLVSAAGRSERSLSTIKGTKARLMSLTWMWKAGALLGGKRVRYIPCPQKEKCL